MQIRALALSAVALLGAGASHAALAPNYQRANELTAIISAVAAAVPKYPIDKIISQGRDRYTVVAGKCTVIAHIVGLPAEPGLVGPRQFKVELDRPRCD
ncbi:MULTISPECIES: hypothetical protein [Ensifer]|jgi:hypothetical protein|uniref:Uncharacterized protein n=1 Tax=Ensifer canadensis TaxID=555315 RepID=A0AAW4FMS8_9HYPH|nr:MULTISPECIES: hypothetical protein [Ensifer]MDP9634229.1 hypothetical protein [Ensifer adhaerens]KQU93620.1 hypothetical protein ASD00_23340 [Ensifer sp. Root31]KQW58612.1 hypothetical protein ASD02_06370 [Ensifer sp. Root1252]KQW74738.1 hypothetical protein ASD03_07010 [Ensifer sp. Root127]KQY78586.1 hypothetical protein ASD52_01675 [Ensifer sp. Root142]